MGHLVVVEGHHRSPDPGARGAHPSFVPGAEAAISAAPAPDLWPPTGALYADASLGSAAGSRRTRGSQRSQLGRYQFQSPSNFMVAGRKTARTTVASISTATARPTPICLNSSALSVAKIENTAIITTAALVTTPAVDLIPCATASPVLMPPSNASR